MKLYITCFVVANIMFTSFLLSTLTGHQHLQCICVGILPSARRVHVTVRAAEDCGDVLHCFISVWPFQLIFAEKTKHTFPLVDDINLFSEKIDHNLLTSWNFNRYCCSIIYLCYLQTKWSNSLQTFPMLNLFCNLKVFEILKPYCVC